MKNIIALLFIIPLMLPGQSLMDNEGGIKISDFPTDNLGPTDEGVIRFNSKNKDFEGWNGQNWISLTTGLIRGSVKDLAGREYETIHIGDQEWMAENLATLFFRSGELIPITINSNDWVGLATAGISFVNDNSSNISDYGILYNWFATIDPRGVCPIGWEVPSREQWEQLREFLGGSDLAYIRAKEDGIAHWASMSESTGLENDSGFNGRGAGVRIGSSSAIYQGFLSEAFWWSTTESDDRAFYARLSLPFKFFQIGTENKRNGLTLRCIKK